MHGGVIYTRNQLLELDPDLADVVEIAGQLFNELGEPAGGPASPEQEQPPPAPSALVDPLEQAITEEVSANPWAHEMLDRRWRSV